LNQHCPPPFNNSLKEEWGNFFDRHFRPGAISGPRGLLTGSERFPPPSGFFWHISAKSHFPTEFLHFSVYLRTIAMYPKFSAFSRAISRISPESPPPGPTSSWSGCRPTWSGRWRRSGWRSPASTSSRMVGAALTDWGQGGVCHFRRRRDGCAATSGVGEEGGVQGVIEIDRLYFLANDRRGATSGREGPNTSPSPPGRLSPIIPGKLSAPPRSKL